MRITSIGKEFVAEVDVIDLQTALDAAAVTAIHAATDRNAALVFYHQPLTGDQQISFTRSLGKNELNTAKNVMRLEQRRLGIEMSDISNSTGTATPGARRPPPRLESRQRTGAGRIARPNLRSAVEVSFIVIH